MDGAHTPSLDELLGQERWLRALARRLVRDAATADDLVQETWFRTLRSRGGQGDTIAAHDARSWLTRVLTNVWRERGRAETARAGRERRAASAEALPSAREALERVELQRGLAAIVLELAEPYRSVVVWRYYEGRSAAEIAGQLGEPAARVRWRLMRARELLRQRLERERGDWRARYALFLPLAQRGVPGTATAASAGGAAGFGVLSMSAKSFLLAGAGALLVWGLVRLTSDPSGGDLEPSGAAHVSLVLGGVPPPASELLPASSMEPERSAVTATEREALTAGPSASAALGLGSLARLSGSVRAAEAPRVLEGVELGLFAAGGRTLRESTRSDAGGAFLFAEVEPGEYDLALRIAGRLPRRWPGIQLTAGSETRLELELERGFLVTVEVVEGTSGAPIPAAEVQLIAGDRDAAVWFTADERRFRSLSGSTSPAGIVELEGGARGVYQYVVQAPGHASTLGEALLDAARAPLRIALERGGVVFGTVLGAGGVPVEGARVFLNPVEPVRALPEFVFRQNGLATGADGRYRLEGVPAGVYHAVALLPDGSGSFHFEADAPDERRLAWILVEDSADVPLDFHLPAPGRVRGRVLDDAGAAVAGARVSVSWGDFKPGGAGFFPIALNEGVGQGVKDSIHHATQTDADGRFEMASVRISHEPLTLRVRAEGCQAGEIELDVGPGALLEPVITLRRLGASIRGRLTDPDGAPLADRSVGAFESAGGRLGAFYQAKSAADGTYELSLPRASGPGILHRVEPILHDSDPLSSDPERREGVPSGARDVDFVLRPLQRVYGTVVDETGGAVRDFVVHGLERAPAAEARWNAQREANRGEGTFDLFLDPTRLVLLRFSAPGCDPSSLSDLASDAEQRVVLRHAADLHGIVLDAAGRGVGGAVVALATLDSAIYPRGTEFAPRDTTDAAGRFRLRGVPDPLAVADAGPTSSPGHLLVCPRRDDAPPLLHFALPAQRGGPLELVLPRCAPVELEFRDAHANPLAGGVMLVDAQDWPLEPVLEVHLADQASPTRGVLEAGRTRFQLPAGTYRAVLVRPDLETRTFPFEVTQLGADGGALQQRSFTLPPGE